MIHNTHIKIPIVYNMSHMQEGAAIMLGKRLLEGRTYLGLSQDFVGERLGISQASISRIESGEQAVEATMLTQFARLYRRPVGWLLGELPEFVPSAETADAIARAEPLSDSDRNAILKFAEFLSHAGKPPRLAETDDH